MYSNFFKETFLLHSFPTEYLPSPNNNHPPLYWMNDITTEKNNLKKSLGLR